MSRGQSELEYAMLLVAVFLIIASTMVLLKQPVQELDASELTFCFMSEQGVKVCGFKLGCVRFAELIPLGDSHEKNIVCLDEGFKRDSQFVKVLKQQGEGLK